MSYLEHTVAVHYKQVEAYQRLLIAAQKMLSHWAEFERLVELGDPQAVELKAAVRALMSGPRETAPKGKQGS